MRGGFGKVCPCVRFSQSYVVLQRMTTSFTFRLDSEKREKLRRKARTLGKTESELLREILDRELETGKKTERLKALAGSLSLKGMKLDGWKKSIRENNWRQ